MNDGRTIMLVERPGREIEIRWKGSNEGKSLLLRFVPMPRKKRSTENRINGQKKKDPTQKP